MTDSNSKMGRREVMAGSLVVGAAMLVGCDDGGDETDAGPGGGDAGPGGGDAGPGGGDAGPLECNAIDSEIGNRHPPGLRHAIDVPIADVMAGGDVIYDIQGDSRHPHTVVVTAADFMRIAAGERVTILSSEDMGVDLHDHEVTLFCSA